MIRLLLLSVVCLLIPVLSSAQCTDGVNAAFSFSGDNQCSNFSVQFSNQSTGSGLTYEWDFGNPTSGAANSSTANNPTHEFISSGSGTESFQVQLIATGSNGCKDTLVQTLTMKQSPGATLEDPINDFRNCDGTVYSILLFDITPTSGNTSYQIIWGDGSPDFSDANFPGAGLTHDYGTDDIFNLLYIVTGSNGCVDTTEYTVANITNPSIGAANPGGTTGCGPLEICFPLNNFSSNHSSTTYTIDFGDGTPIDTIAHPPPDELCHTYDKTSCGSGDNNAYTFKISAINFCDVSEATITPIKIYLKPEAQFEAPENACVSSSVNFINTTIAGFFGSSCSQFTQCTWDFGDGTVVNTNDLSNQSHSYAATGTYTVTLSATNNCGTSTFTKDICIESIPVPDFTIDADSACAPLQINTDNLSSSGDICVLTYAWNVALSANSCNQSSSESNFINGTDPNSFEPIIEILNPGDYQINLSVTNSCGVFNKNLPVVVQGPPQVNISSLPDLCLGESSTPGANITSCLAPVQSYSWTFQNGSPANSSQEDPGSISYSTPGEYTVSLEVSNQCGTSNDQQTIRVLGAPNDIHPRISNPICPGSDVQLFCDTVLGASYSWSGPGGFTSNQQNPIVSNVSASNEGYYYVTATLGSCPGPRDSVELLLIASALVDAGPDDTVCLQDAGFTITPNSAGGGDWSGNGIDNAGFFDPSLAGAGQHTLTYTYEDPASGCINSDQLLMTVGGPPSVNAGSDLNMCNQAIPVQLTATPSGGSWSGPGITDPDGEFTPFATGSFEIIYSLSDANNCSNSDTILISVVNASTVNAGNDTLACANESAIQLNGSPAGGSWSGSGVSSGGLFTPGAPGSIDLVYELGSGSCLSRDTLTVTVQAKPNVDAGPDFDVCIGSGTGTLNGTPSGGSWSGAAISDPSGTYDPSLVSPGTHTLTYSFTDPVTGCSNSDNLSMNVISSPVVDAGPDTSICNQPFPVQLFASPAGGTWSGPNVTADGIFTPSTSGTFTLTYSLSAAPPCTAEDSRVITVSDPAVADAGPDFELCYSEEVTFVQATPPGGSWSGPLIQSDGSITPNASGSYELVYSYGAGNCLTQDTTQLIIHDLPVIGVDPDRSFCPYDSPVNFSASPSGGSWSGNGITDPANGLFDPGSVSNQGNINYVVYEFTELTTGCINRDSLQANVFILPLADFNYSSVICSNSSENFTSTSQNASSFFWDFGDGSPVQNEEHPAHSYVLTGNFDIELLVISTDGCRDSISKAIEIRESPSVQYDLSTDEGCGPLSVDFSNLSSGVGSLNYFWDFGNGQNSSDQNPESQNYVAGILNDTIYVVQLDVSNMCGTVSSFDTITVKTSPTADFGTMFNTGCSPYEAQIANNSYGFPDSFQWNFGDGQSSTTSDALFEHTFVTGDEDTIYQIELIVSNECGSDTGYHSIHILPRSVNAFFNTSTLSGCAPLDVDFTNFSTGAQFYNWDLGNGNTSNAYDASTTYTTAGNYVVTLIINDDCSRDTARVSIEVHPRPDIDFSYSPNTVCVGQEFQFTDLSSDITQLVWEFGDGDSSLLNNPTHVYDTSGTFPVTLNGFNTIYQCQTSIQKNVAVAESPVANFELPDVDACSPATFSFTNTSSNYSFVSWDYGDGNLSTSVNGLNTYTEAGSYQVQLTVENQTACRDSIIQTVVLYPRPTADFDFVSIDSCELPAGVKMLNQSTGADSYLWNFGNGEQSVLTHPEAIYQSPGNYFIKLLATNSYGCQDSITKPVQIFLPPLAGMFVSSSDLCERQPIVLTSSSLMSDSAKWFTGDGTIISGNQVTHQYQDLGSYSITMVAYGQGGCSDTVHFSTPINVKLSPTADFEYLNIENNFKKDGTIQFTNLSQDAQQYIWELDEEFFSDQVHPTYKYDEFGELQVKLTAINDNGCRDTLTTGIIVDVFHGLHVANAMYPGHPVFDVANFVPKGVGLSFYHISIYDDWGNLIWESSELDEFGRPTGYWDGTYQGKPVQEDVYVWKVEATYKTAGVWEGKKYPDGTIKRSGTVTLIR